jgi:quercetin dioxygenase-like cupin family protein
MTDREVHAVVTGEGYAVGAIDGMGEGYGFRKIRRELGVSEFGVNAVVIPAGYETGRHFHEHQQELYFVHSGRLEFEFEDGSTHVLGPGGAARVDPSTVRRYRNVGDGDAVCLIVGAQGGYVGRDGRAPEDEESPRGPGFEGPPGAGPPLPDERA